MERLGSCNWWLSLVLTSLTIITEISTQATGPCGKSTQFVIENPWENLPIGAVAARVDIPGTDEEVVLSQIGTNEYFQLDPTSRNITVIHDLELPVDTSTDITIQCEVLDDRTKNSEINYFMVIVDLNNHSPVFQKEPYTTSFTELLPPGYVIFDGIHAIDGDPSNSYILYEIQSGPYSDHFTFVAASKGEVQLEKMVDFEQVQVINLTIIAKDRHPEIEGMDHVTLNSTAHLIIHIEDGDDQNPVFEQNTYTGRVSENANLDTVVSLNPEVSAYNPDVFVNSTITYSIPQDPDNGDWEYFNINPTTGQITVKNPSLVRGTVHTFLVQASKTSNQNHYSQALVHVTVQAANENAPYFLQGEYKVNNLMENSPVGSSVITVQAVDDDIMSPSCNKTAEGSKLVYSLAGVDDFGIDECTGDITTAKVLSYEDQPSYDIRVIVSDGTFFDEAIVRVSLFNVNTHNPVFQQSVYEFEGKRERGHTLGTVKAEDRDSDSDVTYTLGSFESEFHIDPKSGNLTVHLDLEEVKLLRTEYTVVIVVEDERSPPRKGFTQVLLTFDPVDPAGPTIGQALEEPESNVVIVVVLGVLIGVLLVVIAILCFCIYRKHIRQETLESDLPDYFDTRQHRSQVTLIKVIPFKSSLTFPQQQQDLNSGKSPNSKPDGCERSTSFQNSIDFNQRVTRSWTDPQKEAVKLSNQERLDYYNSVTTDDHRTTMAENPFQQQQQQSNTSSLSDLPLPPPPLIPPPAHIATMAATEDDFGSGLYAYHSVSDVDYPTDTKGHVIIPSPEIYARPVKRMQLDGCTTNAYSTDAPTGYMSPVKDLSSGKRAEYMPPPPDSNQNRFDSDTDVVVPRNLNHSKYISHDMNVMDNNSPRSSYSDENYNLDMTSFKVGSTTQLVGTPTPPTSKGGKSRSGSSMLSRGSGNMSTKGGSGSLNLHKGNGNISFVDTVDISPPNSLYSSMTSQRSGIDPNSGQDEDGRPGITVYY